MVPTFSGTRFNLASLQTVSTRESCPCSIVRHGYVAITKISKKVCDGTVTQMDKSSVRVRWFPVNSGS